MRVSILLKTPRKFKQLQLSKWLILQIDMKITVEISSLKKGSSNTITGIINVSTDGFAFPEKSWNDSVVIVINWWLSSLEKLLQPESTSEKFSFMDGPFSFKVMKGDQVHIHFYRECHLIKSIEVSHEELEKSILNAAKSVNDKCLSEGWNTQEALELRERLTKYYNLRGVN